MDRLISNGQRPPHPIRVGAAVEKHKRRLSFISTFNIKL